MKFLARFFHAERWRQSVWASVAGALVALAIAVLPVFDLAEQRARDGLTTLVLQKDTVAELAVVDISEETLKRVGAWPWSRSQLAELVEQLLGPLGARGVALDLVLPVQGDAAGDARLASLVRHAPLALGQVLDFETRQVLTANGVIAGGRAATERDAALPRASGYVGNHAALAGARCVGHIGVQLDADGVLRRLALQARLEDRVYDSLGLALLACAENPRAANGAQRLDPGGQGLWRVPFRKDLGAFLTVPAEAVLHDEVDGSLLRGRYVLVGASAVGLSDHVATPLQPVTAGVLVHAQTLAELLEASASPQATAPAWAWPAAAVAATGLGALFLTLTLTHSIAAGMALLLALIGAWSAVCSWGFGAGQGPAVLPPLAAWVVTTGTWLAQDFARARAATRQVMQTLSQYVAAPVLRVLVKQGLRGTLVPSRRDITVLVADMAGYTQLTAQSSLEDSARLTIEFLNAITLTVLDSEATLDRYTGDGLIAFWGAPLAQADHADRAVETAQRMLSGLARLNETRRSRGEPPIRMRIGIESGEALVGDLGSSARSVYTAVGTCINLASRLQEAARDRPESVLIGPQTQGRLRRQQLRALCMLPIRGLAEPVSVFTLPVGEPTSHEAGR